MFLSFCSKPSVGRSDFGIPMGHFLYFFPAGLPLSASASQDSFACDGSSPTDTPMSHLGHANSFDRGQGWLRQSTPDSVVRNLNFQATMTPLSESPPVVNDRAQQEYDTPRQGSPRATSLPNKEPAEHPLLPSISETQKTPNGSGALRTVDQTPQKGRLVVLDLSADANVRVMVKETTVSVRLSESDECQVATQYSSCPDTGKEVPLGVGWQCR